MHSLVTRYFSSVFINCFTFAPTFWNPIHALIICIFQTLFHLQLCNSSEFSSLTSHLKALTLWLNINWRQENGTWKRSEDRDFCINEIKLNLMDDFSFFFSFLITLLAFLTSGFNLSVFFFPFSFSISWILEFPGIKGLEIGLRFIVCFTAFSVYYLPFFLFWILFYFLLVCCLNRVYRSLKIVKFIFIHLRILGGGNLLCLHSYGDSYMNLLCICKHFPHL